MTGAPIRFANDDDLNRLHQELAAAPTRAEATAIFENADWIFVNMHPEKRAAIYKEIEDVINEKPEWTHTPAGHACTD